MSKSLLLFSAAVLVCALFVFAILCSCSKAAAPCGGLFAARPLDKPPPAAYAK